MNIEGSNEFRCPECNGHGDGGCTCECPGGCGNTPSTCTCWMNQSHTEKTYTLNILPKELL